MHIIPDSWKTVMYNVTKPQLWNLCNSDRLTNILFAFHFWWKVDLHSMWVPYQDSWYSVRLATPRASAMSVFLFFLKFMYIIRFKLESASEIGVLRISIFFAVEIINVCVMKFSCFVCVSSGCHTTHTDNYCSFLINSKVFSSRLNWMHLIWMRYCNVSSQWCYRLKDCPGVKLKCVRGKYDLAHVVKPKPWAWPDTHDKLILL